MTSHIGSCALSWNTMEHHGPVLHADQLDACPVFCKQVDHIRL